MRAWLGAATAAMIAVPSLAKAAEAIPLSTPAPAGPSVLGIPVEFILFALTLLGVALFHHRTFTVALSGLTAIALYKLVFTGFGPGPGLEGFAGHLWHERITLSNLFLLLLGFAVLSRQFEDSQAPEAMPRLLPDHWTGGLALLGIAFVLSAFLDNIAAALITGVIARHVYHGKVHIGYLAGIVAAANAGGSGSVVGDTTTTMMWIAGVSPLDVLHAYIAACAGFFVYAIPLSIIQQRHHPIQKHTGAAIKVDHVRLGVVAFILVAAISANVSANLYAPHFLDVAPVLGLSVWAAILVTAFLRRPNFSVVPANLKGTAFLIALVTCASLMPVDRLPEASWQTSFGLGFVSSVFDNIPLTALAIKQGGYDWGVLAYAVGFGGSMVWFGSSAGVALSGLYPEAKSVGAWLRHGWWVVLGYVVGFFVLLAIWGWQPHAPIDRGAPPAVH